MFRRSWVEINLTRLASNYRICRARIPDSERIMAVVKADGYGHGAVEVARTLSFLGCRDFAVSNLEEAIQLREAGIGGQILILGYTPPLYAEELKTYRITQALLSEEYAAALAGKGIRAQFAIDTGMNRIGLDGDDPEECETIIRRCAEAFELNGLFTHLAAADTPEEREFTEEQITKFRRVAERVSDLGLPDIHCMNTAGGLFYPPYGSLVRLGIAMYGLKPDYSNRLPEGILPVLSWKAVVAMVKTVRKGETVGYGRAFRAERDMRVVTIPTGYADGYNRALSGKGAVLIGGKKAPILGRICMDQLMVDGTGLDVKPEDEVTLLGDGYSADDMAHDIGTIGYEVVCDIGKRVTRRYVE